MKLSRDEMTDTQRFYSDVKRAERFGAHSHDLADSIPSLNVSQRAKDCVTKGQQVYTRPERRNGRAGARYWLEQFAPEDSTPVRPNDAGRSHDPSPSEGVMEQTPPVVVPPSAEPLSWCWSKQTGWVQRPVREVLAGWERRAA